MIFWICVLLHVFADFWFQIACHLNEFKDKFWWRRLLDKEIKTIQSWDRPEREKKFFINKVQTKYNSDYKIAMLLHSFSWSVITFMPVFIMYSGHLGWGDWQAGVIIGINAMIHYWVDDRKCNLRSINLVQDQVLHLLQIGITLLIFTTIKGLLK